jgi:CRISPR-associated protein Cmr1
MSSQVTIRVRQSTPAFVGYYEPELIDTTYFLRPTSIKGIWRWFARAVVAGALYDSNLLCGKEDKNVVRRPTDFEVKAISRIVGEKMGLGYSSGSKMGGVSKYKIRVEVVRRPQERSASSRRVWLDGRVRELQRIGLLTIHRKDEPPPKLAYFLNGEFNIIIEPDSRLPSASRELALRTLLLSLSLSGIGKGSRRALGSLDIIRVEGLSIERDLKSFLSKTRELALQLVKDNARLEKCKEEHLPPMPSIASRKVSNDLYAFQLYRTSNMNWEDIHNFFLRSIRCKKITGNFNCQDDLRRNLEAWILGLPRKQKPPGHGSDYTGYGMDKDVERRASPIFIVYHGDSHWFKNGAGAYISVFVSGDWPKRIYWYGGYESDSQPLDVNDNGEKLNVKEDDIIQATRHALQELGRYLNKKPHGVWP